MRISFADLARALELREQDLELLLTAARLPFSREPDGCFIEATDLPAWRAAAQQIME
jgi:hypothetical protein